uniref:Uncharacterized protein n=1 Tax=Picea sitchensis TaxID=3332 RepID=A0A6B9XS75_PICSI|nr:hypothetical protein Q903MT_gene3870 [Picea sitchensis]
MLTLLLVMDQRLLHHDLINIDQDHNQELEQLLTLYYN